MGYLRGNSRFLVFALILLMGLGVPGALGWSKEGHMMTCRIAQKLLGREAAHAVEHLLPHDLNGDLSALCVWPDQVRHWYKYRWTSPLHFIDTPDNACTFDYSRDCGKDKCVAGAIHNFTSQLLHYKEGSTDRRYNLTEALLFLSHFMGDIHQPMHVGFTSDEGGNTIELRWFRHKSNLHHVWDREIILTALKDYYDNDMDLLQKAIEGNFTDGIWYDDVASWKDCDDLLACPNKYAVESINIACKWAYKGVKEGETLGDEYFDSRMPIVMKRIAQGGVRLAMYLNHIFGDTQQGNATPTRLIVYSFDLVGNAPFILDNFKTKENMLQKGRIIRLEFPPLTATSRKSQYSLQLFHSDGQNEDHLEDGVHKISDGIRNSKSGDKIHKYLKKF